MDPPDLFTYFYVRLDAIPDRHDILTLSDADCATTDLWPLFTVIVLVTTIVTVDLDAVPSTFVKHITQDTTYEILPYAISNTFS